jgi:DNA-binding NtrC family response regulator
MMRCLLKDAERAAASDGTILLTGESGSGKSRLAKQIHDWSPRRSQPFTVIDCVTLCQPTSGTDHAGGSLDVLQIGPKWKLERLKIAPGGTLFLANVEYLSLALQVEFARFVQDRTLATPEGEKPINVRIIAASNCDLRAEVQTHRFREDLFYGLNIISLSIPPLRQRPDDIMALAFQMLAIAAVRHHRGSLHLSGKAVTAIARYHWPGNLRELRNAMEAAAVLCRSNTITPANLPDALVGDEYKTIALDLPEARLDEIEREHIARVLADSPTLKHAAATLGVSLSTLWRKRMLYRIAAAPKTKAWKHSPNT